MKGDMMHRDDPAYIIEERLLTIPWKEGRYKYSAFVYDPEGTIIRSADVVQLGPFAVHEGAHRDSPLFLLSPKIQHELSDRLVTRASDKQPLARIRFHRGSWLVIGPQGLELARLNAPRDSFRALLRAVLKRPDHFRIEAQYASLGEFSIERVPTPEGTGLVVLRWVLRTRLQHTQPQLFDLVLCASIRAVLFDTQVPVRTPRPGEDLEPPRRTPPD